jgi:MFS family permease
MLLLSLFGGVIADRLRKKHVLIAGQASSALVSFFIGLALAVSVISPDRPGSWLILLAASVVQGIIMGVMMPSRQAMIREIVDQEQLMNATALNALGMNSLRLLAPAIAGFLIAVYGFQAVYFTMTGMYIMAVVFISRMPVTETATIGGRSALADIRAGFGYIRQETTIFLLLVINLLIVLLSMPYLMLLPVFTEDVLKVGATGLGILVSVSGIGAIAGSIVLASLPSRKRGLMLIASAMVLGLALTGFAFSSTLAFSLVLIFLVGVGQTGRLTLSNALLQYYVADAYRGRVMSVYMMEFGLASFAVFLAALLSEGVGVQWAVGSFAIVLIFMAILMLIFMPRIRKLD